MAISAPHRDKYRLYVLDQLQDIPGIGCQQMYSGVALYQHGVFFGIVAEGRLYLKTDEHTVDAYLERDMPSFHPAEHEALRTYHLVPEDVVADSEELVRWAMRSIMVANRQLDR